MMKFSSAAIAVALFATALFFGMPGKARSQGATCSGWYDGCYQKSIGGMSPAKAKADCNAAVRNCKKTGCFVGPHSGSTFACNLTKQ